TKLSWLRLFSCCPCCCPGPGLLLCVPGPHFNEVKQRKTVKYHILRRQMTPRGPPERKLTWDAMQEIRHLKQEQPEEWTIERLAEGFSVSKDTILRVLRSKFAPSSERQAKQDTKVMAKHKQQVLFPGPRVEPEKLRLTSSTRAALSAGSGNSALIPMGGQSLIPQTEQNPGALSVVTKHQFSGITKLSTEMPQEEIQHSTESTVVEEDVEEEEDENDGWDGQVLSEEDIELITVKATPVVKQGNEFFDVDGNFLFKV
uniref:Neugrin n=1 Tax=Neogobius melanostomus TaxID=47308 RepID=A0A8C6U114_9GOBI